MKCSNCGQEARLVRRPYAFGKGDDLLVVENVPTISCRNCGQEFLEPATVRGLDRIRRNRGAFAADRSVAVAAFEQVMHEA